MIPYSIFERTRCRDCRKPHIVPLREGTYRQSGRVPLIRFSTLKISPPQGATLYAWSNGERVTSDVWTIKYFPKEIEVDVDARAVVFFFDPKP